jgi:hypothetical protein
MSQTDTKQAVLIIAKEIFRDEELFVRKKFLKTPTLLPTAK